MNKETADTKAKDLINKAKSEKTWWKKLLYWLAGILLLGASTYYLASCSMIDKYDVDYNHDSGTVTISPKPVIPAK